MMNKIKICQSCGMMESSRHINVCAICGKHICRDCVHHDYHERMKTNYPDSYCEKCWNIGKPYRSHINKLELEFDIVKEKITSVWYDKVNEIRLEQIPPLVSFCNRYKLSCKYGSIKYHIPTILSDEAAEYYYLQYKDELCKKYIHKV